METLTRLLNVPETPPRSWFNSDPDEMVMGQTLHVVTTGPDEGRAYGLIQPPPEHSAYMPGKGGRRHRNYGRRPPDARLYVDGMAVFNRGAVSVTEEDGSISTIAAGVLPVFGGHAQEAIGASNIDEAVEWLHREGRWTSRADQLGLVGVASPVDHPEFGGAVMFRGAALPGMTLREAHSINAQSVSAEVWESPQYNNELVFAGAVVVNHTAWPYHRVPEALAAEADDADFDGVEPECSGPFCVVFAAATQEEDLVVPADPDQSAALDVEPTPDGGGSGCSGACSTCKCNRVDPPIPTDPATANAGKLDEGEPDPNVPPAPGMDSIAAEGLDTETRIAELTSQVAEHTTALEDLAKQLEDQGVEVFELTATVFGSQGMGADNQLAEMSQMINDLREQVAELAQRAGAAQPAATTEGSDAPDNAPPASNALTPAMAQSSQRGPEALQSALRG